MYCALGSTHLYDCVALFCRSRHDALVRWPVPAPPWQASPARVQCAGISISPAVLLLLPRIAEQFAP
eukprot:2855941-Pyramimonas_sp.AAC.1